ncbi:MAG: hypothetical protein ACE37B_06755 [Ilumatobacter sp.]|uniref:hypothetical protein n=1 Tax=Ilumatobacter sp. TaxID=1967498 RepID=UPI003919E013
MNGGSAWMVISMIAFSIFLLLFFWSILRPARRTESAAADLATERSGHGQMDGDFERIVRDIKAHKS